MNAQDMTLLALAGMAAGPEAAVKVMEGFGDRITGKEQGGTLELPRPHDKETLLLTRSWGFEWPEGDDTYDRNMARNKPLTVQVKVPAGWSIVRTDHYLYKNLLDPKGQVRASLMLHYQDHDSWLSPVRKYSASVWQANYSDSEPCWPVIEDSNGNVLWVGNKVEAEPDHRERYAAYWKEVHAKGDVDHKVAEANAPVSPHERAGYTASTVLKLDLGIDPADQKWFDAPFEFPPSVGTLPVVKTYSYYVSYHHEYGGHCTDSGSSPIKAASDKEAIDLVKAMFKGNSGYYRKATLSDPDGKKIWNNEDPPPQPKFRKGRDVYDPWGDCYMSDGRYTPPVSSAALLTPTLRQDTVLLQ